MSYYPSLLPSKVLNDFAHEFETVFSSRGALGKACNGATPQQLRHYRLGAIELKFRPPPLHHKIAMVVGFPRSGTSFLQSLLQQALPIPSIRTYTSGQIWPALAIWKHTPRLIEKIQSENPGELVVFSTLRPMLDCLTSWAIKDQTPLTSAWLLPRAESWLTFVTAGLVNNWQFVSFCMFSLPNLTLAKRLQHSFELENGLSVSSEAWANSALTRIAQMESPEELFRLAKIGDSTGLSAKDSLMRTYESHLPNEMKNLQKTSVKSSIVAKLPHSVLRKAAQVEQKARRQVIS